MFRDRFSSHRLDERQIELAMRTVRTLLQTQEPVSFAYLHGSALSFQRGEQSVPPSDIDVAIYLTSGDWIKIELDLQSEFYRHTGLSPEILDVHTLNNAPVKVAMEIIKSGELLFRRDPILHADFLESVSNSCRRLSGLLELAYA